MTIQAISWRYKLRLRVDLSAVQRMELIRTGKTGQVSLVERSPVVEKMEGRFEGVRAGRRWRWIEVVVTLTLVTVGQHVDSGQLLSRLERADERTGSTPCCHATQYPL